MFWAANRRRFYHHQVARGRATSEKSAGFVSLFYTLLDVCSPDGECVIPFALLTALPPSIVWYNPLILVIPTFGTISRMPVAPPLSKTVYTVRYVYYIL